MLLPAPLDAPNPTKSGNGGAYICVCAYVFNMTETVPVRMDRDMLESLDLLVKTGLYPNRSEAIRELMKKGFDSLDGPRSLGRLVKLIRELDSAGKLDFSGLSLERETQ